MNKNTVKLKINPEENIVNQPLDEIVRNGAKTMLQKALEIEVDLFLEKYQYILDDKGNRRVVRNGRSRARKIVAGAGQIEIKAPRIDDRTLEIHHEPRFKSSIVPPYLRRTKNIDELLPLLYLKGISTGDFSEALESILGKNVIGLSAQNIVRLKQVWQKEYEQWSKRELSHKEYVYWWADGVHFNVRLDNDRQCILVIIGVTLDGQKEIIAVSDGFRESKESWKSVIREVKRLGITTAPKLAIGDGALGFWAAVQEEFPETNHQLCWVHKTANVLDKLPKSLQGKAKTMIHDIYLAPTKVDANNSFDVFIEEFEAKYPKAVDCMRKHRGRLLEFYNYPAEHWLNIRTTNAIESVFATVRLRTYRTKGCGSRIATLTMVFKLIQSAQKRWNKIRFAQRIKQVWEGIIFEDGIEVQESKILELVSV
ncbi:MAG: IS256 family transposase [Candidatus Omnitrophica bacterium]|nr:IS256 family transposase [Candidatus Omnitrophota bacterium]